jgi:rRNA maturation endonuclease Nob1
VSDDQADIEKRVLANIGRVYHCAYCHSTWHEGKNGRCVSCGSGRKICNSVHARIWDKNDYDNGTESGGPK